MNSRFAVILFILIAGFGGIFFFSKQKASAPTGNNQAAVSLSNHVDGKGLKGVKLVEYGDFQCPACSAYYPLVKQIKEKYKDDITFQFRNFPISSIHQNAMAAHRAVEAADKQGKFWEMHDQLYENQTSWKDAPNAASIFQSYASALGLNIDKYKQDVASRATNDVIRADIKEGTRLGVKGTPTFVLEGKKIDQNPQDLEAFIKLIDNAIANKNQ